MFFEVLPVAFFEQKLLPLVIVNLQTQKQSAITHKTDRARRSFACNVGELLCGLFSLISESLTKGSPDENAAEVHLLFHQRYYGLLEQ